ncbi:MAG: biotin/lipoyl-binding protein [Pirellulales bacterium]|nr:biotin/lipoyl-binding protein [Pirellulales bacterium]
MVGTVKASSRTEISARLLAPINKIHVYVGQMVQAGDVLIELDPRAFETDIGHVRSGLHAARSARARESGSPSESW